MSHAVTAQDLFFEMKRMPPAERVKFFALLSENAFRDDDFSHGQVFGHLEGETLSAAEAAEAAEAADAAAALSAVAAVVASTGTKPLASTRTDVRVEARAGAKGKTGGISTEGSEGKLEFQLTV